jgi:hypothetical protein
MVRLYDCQLFPADLSPLEQCSAVKLHFEVLLHRGEGFRVRYNRMIDA